MKRRFLAAALIPLVCLSGCSGVGGLPYAREMENMALIRTLGVDTAEDGVQVTASSARQRQGDGETAALVLSGSARTASAACLTMQTYGTAYVFYGHVSQLLLGEDMARQGLREVLDYVERDLEMRLETELFVVREATAEEAIFAASDSGSASERLEAIRDDGGFAASASTRTIRDVLSDLYSNGASYAPGLELIPGREGDGGEGEKQLSAGLYAILRGDALVGWAEGAAALGINLLQGDVESDVVEIPAENGDSFALRVVEAESRVKAVFEGDTLAALEVECQVEANLAQAPETFSDWEEAGLEELERELERIERNRVQAALDLAQSLDADFLGLGKRAGLAAPWRWHTLEQQWDSAFADLPIRLTVEGKIQRSYDMMGQER